MPTNAASGSEYISVECFVLKRRGEKKQKENKSYEKPTWEKDTV